VFNLLMSGVGWKLGHDTFGRTRVFEHTAPEVEQLFKPGGVLNLEAVTNIPTLFASETRFDDSQDLARIGRLTRVRLAGAEYQLDYTFDADIPPIPNTILKSLARVLDIDDWEFSRTHWAIKDSDLFEMLMKAGLGQRPKPKVFDLGTAPVDPNLVAVMMPFSAQFMPVYTALHRAVADSGMICQRADDIWVHDHIIQDVVSLICKASVVVCDLTGRNPNVFYEMGIAHAVGKDVIMITQAAADVPFDVAHIRHIRYLPNGEGISTLVDDVTRRLAALRTSRGA
jgi:hypothetical protein